MEQNLSNRERRLRLGIGLLFAAAAIFSYLQLDNIYVTAGLIFLASGFIANYLTCFCGTKKLVSKLKS